MEKDYYFQACDFLEKDYDAPQQGGILTTIEDVKDYNTFKELDFDAKLDAFLEKCVTDPEADRALIEKEFNDAFEWAWEEIIRPQLKRLQEELEEEIHSLLEENYACIKLWSMVTIIEDVKNYRDLKELDFDGKLPRFIEDYLKDNEADRALIEKDFTNAFLWGWDKMIQPQLESEQEKLKEKLCSLLEAELEGIWSDAAIKAALKKIINPKGKDHE